MRRFSRGIREKLIRAGWYEGRDVLQEVNIPKSFNTFPAALQVLREFGNLTLWGKSTVEIDPSLEEGIEECLALYEAQLGVKLCLLGSLDEGHGSMVIDELGGVYAMWGVSGEFDLVGTNFEQALDSLLLGGRFTEERWPSNVEGFAPPPLPTIKITEERRPIEIEKDTSPNEFLGNLKREGDSLTISLDLSAQISERVEKLKCSLDESLKEAINEYTEEAIKFMLNIGALPLYNDMGGGYALKPNGEIVSSSWDEAGILQVENDQRLRNIALFQGSKKYPELSELIDANPHINRLCPDCKGTGIAPLPSGVRGGNFLCYCGGLGWLPKS